MFLNAFETITKVMLRIFTFTDGEKSQHTERYNWKHAIYRNWSNPVDAMQNFGKYKIFHWLMVQQL